MSQRLADSKRNELLANFIDGKEDPEYEVIPSKTTKGKYTVSKRKVNLPVEVEEEKPSIIEPKEDNKEEPEEKVEGDMNYFNPYNPYIFQDYQMMMNKMFVEHMKYENKKREKLKDKSKKIYNLLYNLAKPKEEVDDRQEVSSFNLMIADSYGNTMINVDMNYSDSQFTVSSGGTGIIDGIATSDSFYCGKMRENLSISSFIITIIDSSQDVLCKYTLEPGNVDSSSIISYGAIDEVYVKKTEYENNVASHTHAISDKKKSPVKS